jgi:hypothetical protein
VAYFTMELVALITHQFDRYNYGHIFYKQQAKDLTDPISFFVSQAARCSVVGTYR